MQAAFGRRRHPLRAAHATAPRTNASATPNARRNNDHNYDITAKTNNPPPQPALYEAFGLTVVEAMSCGLPTFATAHGGPSEIIRHGRSGFHIDPYHGDQVMWGAM